MSWIPNQKSILSTTRAAFAFKSWQQIVDRFNSVFQLFTTMTAFICWRRLFLAIWWLNSAKISIYHTHQLELGRLLWFTFCCVLRYFWVIWVIYIDYRINIKKIKKRKTKKRTSKRKRNELVQQTCEWAIVPLPRVTKRWKNRTQFPNGTLTKRFLTSASNGWKLSWHQRNTICWLGPWFSSSEASYLVSCLTRLSFNIWTSREQRNMA